jgi:hypothetical protein
MAVTANLPQMPTRWLTVYRVWMRLVGALAAVAGAVMIFRPRSGGDLAARHRPRGPGRCGWSRDDLRPQ